MTYARAYPHVLGKEFPFGTLFYFQQRYGWHGENDLLQKSFDVAAVKYPWINGYRDRAVTELEYLHGHLNNPGARAACFFFRDKVMYNNNNNNINENINNNNNNNNNENINNNNNNNRGRGPPASSSERG